MDKIRGKSLKEWKENSIKEKNNTPIQTLKYIVCLEEYIAQLEQSYNTNLERAYDDGYSTDGEVTFDIKNYEE